jgi:hypothetical protein
MVNNPVDKNLSPNNRLIYEVKNLKNKKILKKFLKKLKIFLTLLIVRFLENQFFFVLN